MSLTRADLESGHLRQQFIQAGLQAGLNLHVLSDAELEASLRGILQQQPNSEVWLFAYGSLIWNPIFRFADRRVGTIHGLHRRFCLWTPLGRGTPDHPGLVLGLDRGGRCRGIVYRIAAADVWAELWLVWRREMVVGSYVPRWVKVTDGTETRGAITFVVNRKHPCYAHSLTQTQTVEAIATSAGRLGSCSDYLLQTVEGLLSMGIADQQLLRLRDRVLTRQEQPIISPNS